MTFVKNLWLKIKFLFFRKSLPERTFISEQKAIIEDSWNELQLLQNYVDFEDEAARSQIIDQLAEKTTAKTILSYYEQADGFLSKKNNHRELAEFRAELLDLEKRKLILDFARKEITDVNYVDLSLFSNSVQVMVMLEAENHKRVSINNNLQSFVNLQSSEKLDVLLKNRSTLNLHKDRLNKRLQENEIEKSKIKQRLNRLEGAVAQNRLSEAKAMIVELSSEIKPTFNKEILRLNQSRQKVKEKELLILEKARNELVRKHLEEVKRQQEIEHQQLEILKAEKEKGETLKKLKVDEESIEKERLKQLLTKKANWKDFEGVCDKNAITHLYHFTDRANLKSIKKLSGLYSWHYLQRKNIDIAVPGGSALSRDLDKKHGLEDFVRVSFTQDHPMMHVAKRDQRILDPVVLKISLEVCFLEETRFSDRNATKTGHIQGARIEDFNRIRFSVVKQANQFGLNEEDAKYYQAEVMVKTWIPAEFILNINEV